MSGPLPAAAGPRPRRIIAIFFISGFAALLYQLVWQRALTTVYGSNSESVAVVVGAFMLGLGGGSFVGGRIASRPLNLVRAFALIELAISIYGLFSLTLIEHVGEATVRAPPALTAALTFALVVIPTTLMGATLPVLATWVARAFGNVGRAVSDLYFINTLGSAMACLVGAALLLPLLGQQRSVWTAAALNLLAGAWLLSLSRRGEQ